MKKLDGANGPLTQLTEQCKCCQIRRSETLYSRQVLNVGVVGVLALQFYRAFKG